MKTTFTSNHIEDDSVMKEYFEEKAEKLNKYVKRFKDDLIYLHGTLDRNPHKHEFYASVSLYLPSIVLHCHERGGDFVSAMNAAFLDVVRQIEKLKDKLSREKRRKVR